MVRSASKKGGKCTIVREERRSREEQKETKGCEEGGLCHGLRRKKVRE
jgi:hypothetical protein